MLKQYKNFIEKKMENWQWWLCGGLFFLLFNLTMAWLEQLYSETKFPASVMAGQTSFDHEAVKHFYNVMIEQGTLDLYIRLQKLDFIFMIIMFCTITTLTIAAYRSVKKVKYLNKYTWLIAVITPLAPVFDALENTVSFVMLSHPVDFHPILATFHSSFAVIKFFLSFLGIWSALIIGVIAALVFLCRIIKGWFINKKVA